MAPGLITPPPTGYTTFNGPPNGSWAASGGEAELANEPYEPLAVVGFSLKFPQEATSVEGFWKMLLEKRCAMTEWPEDRLNIDAFYHPDNTQRGTVRSRELDECDFPDLNYRLLFVEGIS